jgi:hypothetical protein
VSLAKQLFGQFLVAKGLKFLGVDGTQEIDLPEQRYEYEGLKLDFSPEELAAVFQVRGWTLGDMGFLSADQIAELLWIMSEQLDEIQEPGGSIQMGRFALIKSPEFESTYSAALIIGSVDANMAPEENEDDA